MPEISTISGTVYDNNGNPAVGRTVRAYRRDTGALWSQVTTNASGEYEIIIPEEDPVFTNNVTSLMRFNGTDGSTLFQDSSPVTAFYQRLGTPTISTAQSKFGGSSLFVSGAASNYLYSASRPEFKLGNEDFTVEAFLHQTSASGTRGIAGAFETSSSMEREWVFYKSNNNIAFQWSTTGTGGQVEISVNSGMSNNVWHHVAVCRKNNWLRFFVDGILLREDPFNHTIATTSREFRIGAFASGFSSSWAGYIDEFRLTKGFGHYDANFTPPTEPFYSGPFGYTGEYNIVCLDDEEGTLYNDLILRTTPV